MLDFGMTFFEASRSFSTPPCLECLCSCAPSSASSMSSQASRSLLRRSRSSELSLSKGGEARGCKDVEDDGGLESELTGSVISTIGSPSSLRIYRNCVNEITMSTTFLRPIFKRTSPSFDITPPASSESINISLSRFAKSWIFWGDKSFPPTFFSALLTAIEESKAVRASYWSMVDK